MKILHVIPNFAWQYGGSVRVVYDLSKKLAEKGHDVSIYTTDGAKVKFIRPTFMRFPILDYISFLFSSRNEIKRQIKEFNPDIVIGFSSVLSNYWGMRYAKKNKIPYMYYWYDIVHILNVPKKFSWLAEIIEKEIIKNSDSINLGFLDKL